MSRVASADEWDTWNLGQVANGQDEHRHEMTMRALAAFRGVVPAGSSVLDVGIGAGFTTQALHSSYSYLGLDIAEKSVAKASERNPAARLDVADFVEWPAPEATFDGILCVDTVSYFSDQDAALQKMARALKPGGYLVMTAVNPFVYERFKWIRERKEQRMGKWLSRADLLALVSRNGFQIVNATTIAPAGDRNIWRFVCGRRVKRMLGRPYVGALEALGLGQYHMVLGRKFHG